jgi:NTP pyrophosphatase (non-canonical NTP hydrolase)
MKTISNNQSSLWEKIKKYAQAVILGPVAAIFTETSHKESSLSIHPVTSLSEYQILALRVRAAGTTPYEDLKNGVAGLVTEVAELIDLYKRNIVYGVSFTRKALVEEIGDVLWYLALCHYAFGITMVADPREYLIDITRPGTDMILAKLVRYSSSPFCEVHAYPETAMDSNMEYDIKQLLLNLQFFCEIHSITLFEAAHGNLVKMQKRYPNGFNQTDAVMRDKDYELSHM